MNVPSGYTALDLIGFTDKGAYNSATSYVKNDLVSYNGDKWRCKLDDTVNHTPEEGTYWTIFIDAPSALDDLTDVTISSVANGDILEYDSATSKWKNSTGLSDVKQALSNEVATRAELGAHNLLKYDLASIKENNATGTWNNNVYTLTDGNNTLTFTVNSDLSITVDGSYPSTVELVLNKLNLDNNNLIAGQSYKLVGTPSGGSVSKYFLGLSMNGSTYVTDIGSGNIFTQPAFNLVIGAYIRIASGVLVSNIVFKPMILVPSDSDSIFQPYTMTNRELSTALSDEAKARATLGAHNLGKKFKDGATDVGLTIKDAPDGGNYVNGTATRGGGRGSLKSDNFVLKAGTYSIVGESNDHSKYSSVVLQKTSDNSVLGTYEINNVGVDKSRATVTLAADTECYFGFNTTSGAAYGTDTFIIYPMVKLADDKDDTFYPYAMTNRELTDVAQQEIGNYILTGNGTVTVTGDGTKTYQTLLSELANAFESYLAAHTDEYLRITALEYLSDYVLTPANYNAYLLYNTSLNTGLRFTSVDMESTVTLRKIHIAKTLASNKNFVSYDGVVTDNIASVPASGKTIIIYFDIYKKIS